MNKIRIIDLLNKIANGEIPKTIVYDERYFTYDDKRQNYFSYDDSEIDWKYTVMEYINDEIEIIEDTPKEEKELHLNSIEFNINNDKRDCVITLDENDLGIDKLHLDNCYFYKENDKWYVKKYDFKSFKLEEEKKIPEKLNIEDDGNTITLFGEKENEWTILDNVDVIVCNKINSIIDYLKSKGDE